jgi:hypothetical protein
VEKAMRTKTWLLALAGTLMAWQAPAQSLEEILGRHIEARGGAERIQGVRDARIRGTMTVGPDMTAPFTMEWKRPDRMRLELVVDGQTGVQAFDGTVGWTHLPFLGQTAPQRLGTAEAREMQSRAADVIEGPLIQHHEKGHRVELVGRSEIEGAPAHHLRVTLRGGDVVELWLDADTHLEIQQRGRIHRADEELETVTVYGSYREVAGLVLPHRLTTRLQGSPVQVPPQVLSIDSYSFDVDLEESRFALPSAPGPGTAH